jgi:hypothetical protein
MNGSQQLNLDQNYSECIHAASGLGQTTYYNICGHSVNVVPWGSADWAGCLFLTVLASLLIGTLIFAMVTMVRM